MRVIVNEDDSNEGDGKVSSNEDDSGEGDDGYGGWNDVDGCIDVCCGDK